VRRNGSGFTLIELLVVIAIIAILAAILFPVFAKARDKALASACLSNTKQMALALQMYCQDYDQGLPFLTSTSPYWGYCWPEFLQPYVKNDNIFQCPADILTNARPGPSGYGGDRIASSYGMVYPHLPYRPGLAKNTSGVWVGKLPQLNYPAEQMYALDIVDHHVSVPGDLPVVYCPFCSGLWGGGSTADQHNGGANIVFFDGHAKWMKKDRIVGDTAEARRLWIHTN